MIYVASPFTSNDPVKERERYLLALDFTASLRNSDFYYSPIVHFYHVAREFNLPSHAGYWRHINYDALSLSKEVVMLCADGYTESLGMKEEFCLAQTLSKPIHFAIGKSVAPETEEGKKWMSEIEAHFTAYYEEWSK